MFDAGLWRGEFLATDGDILTKPAPATDSQATVMKIREAFAHRAAIEQDFHDVEGVWVAGQRQVRNI